MMEPDLLAHLCKLIGYLDGHEDNARYLDLAPYMQPIEEIVNRDIESLNVRVPMSDEPMLLADKIEACGHFGDTNFDCLCDASCECKKNGCSALQELPEGITPDPSGIASGYEEEKYFHCPDGCNGWHRGTWVERKVYDDKRVGTAYCCPVCDAELKFVGRTL
jgi:hypothetical protein